MESISSWRPRRGRTYGAFLQLAYVRPLRGRYFILLLIRRFRSLRSLHQRLWMFALFEDVFYLASSSFSMSSKTKRVSLTMMVVRHPFLRFYH